MFCDFFEFDNFVDLENFFGENFCNLNFVENEFNIKIKKQRNGLEIAGESEKVKMSKNVFETMLKFLCYVKPLDFDMVREISNFVKCGKFRVINAEVCLNHRNEVVLIKNFNQMFYWNSIRRNTITFGIGPAGTGKTYLAVAQAVQALKSRLFSKVVFTRPVLEAGESLGFLPGDLQSKVDPFLKPLYDAMCDFVGVDAFNKNLERGVVEVLPLAYMRGRSLSNSFIVLDEAQNTTKSQMKMFLTRLGLNSKMVINGDLNQIDLKNESDSGLLDAVKLLKNIKNIGIVNFEKTDVVRSSLVRRILEAYEKNS